METLLQRRALSIAPGQRSTFTSQDLAIPPGAAFIRVRIPRQTTTNPINFPATAKIRVAIIVKAGNEVDRCDGGTTGGIRTSESGEDAEYVLTYPFPGGATTARVEIVRSAGALDSEIEVEAL